MTHELSRTAGSRVVGARRSRRCEGTRQGRAAIALSLQLSQLLHIGTGRTQVRGHSVPLDGVVDHALVAVDVAEEGVRVGVAGLNPQYAHAGVDRFVPLR